MHLIPFTGRKSSHTYGQNLLWTKEQYYIMDNHRAAAWCWAQVVAPDEKFSIFHVDRHTDLLQSRLAEWCRIAPPIGSTGILDYLNLECELDRLCVAPLFRWDNYLPIFLKQREAHLTKFSTLWHGEGDKPWFPFTEHKHYDAPCNLEAWLSNNEPWIVNLDVDFFFAHRGNDVFVQLFSDDYITCLGEAMRTAKRAGYIRCLTIAISPEMCGGWEPGVRALRIFARAAGLDWPRI